jgi:hypothetical protein
MMVEDNLLSIFKAMFTEREKWPFVTEEQKIKHFFIINRLFSKKFPEKSKLLNSKLINKTSAMDTWFIFVKNMPYPKWFWSKSLSEKVKLEFSDEEIIHIMNNFNLKREDIEILLNFYPDSIKEEIKYYRDTLKPSK